MKLCNERQKNNARSLGYANENMIKLAKMYCQKKNVAGTHQQRLSLIGQLLLSQQDEWLFIEALLSIADGQEIEAKTLFQIIADRNPTPTIKPSYHSTVIDWMPLSSITSSHTGNRSSSDC